MLLLFNFEHKLHHVVKNVVSIHEHMASGRPIWVVDFRMPFCTPRQKLMDRCILSIKTLSEPLWFLSADIRDALLQNWNAFPTICCLWGKSTGLSKAELWGFLCGRHWWVVDETVDYSYFGISRHLYVILISKSINKFWPPQIVKKRLFSVMLGV